MLKLWQSILCRFGHHSFEAHFNLGRDGQVFFRKCSHCGHEQDHERVARPREVEWIICGSQREVMMVKEGVFGTFHNIKVMTPVPTHIFSAPPPVKITVMPSVDLDARIDGTGVLRDVLRSRQAMWGKLATMVVLP